MEKNDIVSTNKSRNVSKTVAVISAVVLVVFIIIAAVIGGMIPRSTRLYNKGEGRITSITATQTEDWFYTTSKAEIYRLNGDNVVTETYDLNKAAEEEGVSTIGEIRSIYAAENSSNIYVSTTAGATKYLFQLENGEEGLSCKAMLPLNGDITYIREFDGELYTISQDASVFKISRYNADDLKQGAISSGHLYTGYIGAGNRVTMKLVKGTVSILSLNVIEEETGSYVYLLHTGGLIRMSTDFTMNNWRASIPARTQEIYDELYAEKLANEEEIVEKELRALAEQTACEQLGVYSYKSDSGEVVLKNFDATKFGNYYPEEVTYRGCAYVEEQNTYYLLTADKYVYSYDVSQVATLPMGSILYMQQVPGLTLAGAPMLEGVALYYNKELQTGYVLYDASNKISYVDFANREVIFTSEADFNIRSLRQSFDGNKVYYLYLNANETATGHLILRMMEIDNQAQEGLLKTINTIAIVLAVVAGIVLIFALLCAFKAGFSEYLLDVLLGFRKHWLLYLILAGCLTLLGFFCYYPAIGSISLSFFDYTQEKPARIWNNFANYIEIFTSSTAAEEFGNMFFFLFFDLFTGIVPPLIFGFFLTIMRNKGYSALMRTLLFIPGIIPGVATTLIWKTGIYGSYGVLNGVIEMLGGEPIRFLGDPSYAKWSLVLMSFPYVGPYLVFYGAMMNVPDSYYEAAEMDGITVLKRFFFIDIPLILAQIKYVFITTFIASVQNFGRVYMVTKGLHGTRTPIFTMYIQINDYFDYGKASAYATVLFIFLFGATLLNMRKQKEQQNGVV